MNNSAKNKIDYILTVRPLFNERAVFSDETASFRQPFEVKAGDEMHIRIRTEEDNVDSVFLISGTQRILMQVVEKRQGFDYYEASLLVGKEPISYYFELICGEYTVYYNKNGISEWHDTPGDYHILPDFNVPAWSKGAVMYQIYTDRFCNGNPDNDVRTGEYVYLQKEVVHKDNWNDLPENLDVGNFYGGDLQGVREKLDYLQDLGVEVLYLNPIFVSPSNHKYDTQDYEHVDPHIAVILNDGENGTHIRETDPENLAASDQYFADLVEEIHRRGMRVILDGVFNHCGSFNKWMDREGIYKSRGDYEPGAYEDQESPYHTYFKFENEWAWPDNGTYVGWWNMETLPKLNYEESPDLVEHIYKIAEKWVSPPYNADGWRLDVAADLGVTEEFNHKFWRGFRERVRKANPEAIILAEHYGNPGAWLKGDQWDTVMNYDGFMEPVSYFLTGMEKHSDEYNENLKGNGEAYFGKMRAVELAFSASSLQCAMNELDNHDHSRFLTRTNQKVGRLVTLGSDAAGEGVVIPVLRQAVVMQMTWVGAPTLYYGDEAGMVGFTDPDNRRTYPWGHENKDLIAFYKEIIRLHKEWPVLRDGSLMELSGGENNVAYGRFNEKEAVVVAVNTAHYDITLSLPVWMLGYSDLHSVGFRFLFGTYLEHYGTDGDDVAAKNGMLEIVLPPHSAVVYGRRD